MSPMRWSAMRMLLRMIDRISSSSTPALYSLTGGRRRPSCSTSVALAEKPPGTMPPISGQWPVLDSHENRSEEHTSELQSLMRISYAVFCLKKKTTTKHDNNNMKTQLTKHTEDQKHTRL